MSPDNVVKMEGKRKKSKKKSEAPVLDEEKKKKLNSELLNLCKDFHMSVMSLGKSYGVQLEETIQFKIVK